MSEIMTIIKEKNPETNRTTYTVKISTLFAVEDDMFIPEQYIADSLIGNLLRVINSYNGEYEIVEKTYIPSFLLKDESTKYMATMLQSYIQKYGPL